MTDLKLPRPNTPQVARSVRRTKDGMAISPAEVFNTPSTEHRATSMLGDCGIIPVCIDPPPKPADVLDLCGFGNTWELSSATDLEPCIWLPVPIERQPCQEGTSTVWVDYPTCACVCNLHPGNCPPGTRLNMHTCKCEATECLPTETRDEVTGKCRCGICERRAVNIVETEVTISHLRIEHNRSRDVFTVLVRGFIESDGDVPNTIAFIDAVSNASIQVPVSGDGLFRLTLDIVQEQLPRRYDLFLTPSMIVWQPFHRLEFTVDRFWNIIVHQDVPFRPECVHVCLDNQCEETHGKYYVGECDVETNRCVCRCTIDEQFCLDSPDYGEWYFFDEHNCRCRDMCHGVNCPRGYTCFRGVCVCTESLPEVCEENVTITITSTVEQEEVERVCAFTIDGIPVNTSQGNRWKWDNTQTLHMTAASTSNITIPAGHIICLFVQYPNESPVYVQQFTGSIQLNVLDVLVANGANVLIFRVTNSTLPICMSTTAPVFAECKFYIHDERWADLCPQTEPAPQGFEWHGWPTCEFRPIPQRCQPPPGGCPGGRWNDIICRCEPNPGCPSCPDGQIPVIVDGVCRCIDTPQDCIPRDCPDGVFNLNICECEDGSHGTCLPPNFLIRIDGIDRCCDPNKACLDGVLNLDICDCVSNPGCPSCPDGQIPVIVDGVCRCIRYPGCIARTCENNEVFSMDECDCVLNPTSCTNCNEPGCECPPGYNCINDRCIESSSCQPPFPLKPIDPVDNFYYCPPGQTISWVGSRWIWNSQGCEWRWETRTEPECEI